MSWFSRPKKETLSSPEAAGDFNQFLADLQMIRTQLKEFGNDRNALMTYLVSNWQTLKRVGWDKFNSKDPGELQMVEEHQAQIQGELAKHGFLEIPVKLGETRYSGVTDNIFDVVGHVPDSSKPRGTIVEVVETGFEIYDDPIVKSKVKISVPAEPDTLR